MPFPAPLGFNHIIHLTVTALTILMQTPEIANCRIESAFTHSYAQTDVSCGSSCSLVVSEIGFTETHFPLHHCLQTLEQNSLMVRQHMRWNVIYLIVVEAWSGMHNTVLLVVFMNSSEKKKNFFMRTQLYWENAKLLRVNTKALKG